MYMLIVSNVDSNELLWISKYLVVQEVGIFHLNNIVLQFSTASVGCSTA